MSTIANPSATSVAINAIDSAAHAYARARALVAERVANYNEQAAALNRRLVPGIKLAAAAASDLQAMLCQQVQASPELFEKPRTMTLHGIKVGFKKGVGSIDWADDEKISEKIAKLLPDQVDVLVKTTHKPIAKALQALDVKTLRALGCTVEETGDFVIVKAEDSAVDKLVARILKEGAIEEAE